MLYGAALTTADSLASGFLSISKDDTAAPPVIDDDLNSVGHTFGRMGQGKKTLPTWVDGALK